MITAHLERFVDLLDELAPLLPRHYEELSLHQFHGIPLNPQYEIYIAREELGELLCVTLRKEGELVGYFIGFISPGLHYKDCLTLIMDIFYVLPEHRGEGAGVTLFTKVKEEAKRRGVRAWFVGDKEHAKVHAEKLFTALGFERSENFFCMWLGE